jgi:S-DNA-T family DNA segregation ATPase FtsK/SpoIIIE
MMYWLTPDAVRFALSDTKSGGGLEFNHYRGSPHLLREPANSMYATWELMDWLIEEADIRLREIGRNGYQNIQQYNLNQESLKSRLPYWVLIIDELADVLGGDKRGEAKIANAKLGRIVQKSRAAGIHVIAATQRPSVDIIKGTVKNNFPARLSFKLSSDVDSRTVLNTSGADHLLPRGDMLYLGPTTPGCKRLHSAYASLEDIKQMVNLTKLQHAM